MKNLEPRVALLAATLAFVFAGAPGGCALSGTGGELVELSFAFGSAATDGEALGTTTTRYDPSWTVELREAYLVLGATYVFPPAEVAAGETRDAAAHEGLLDLLERFSRSTAYAHAGDDNLFAVNALAEYREPVVIDALTTTPIVVEGLLGEAGEASLVSVWIDAPRDSSGPTHGYHGWVAGVARRGDQELSFEAGITLEDTPLSQRVDRISLPSGSSVTEGSRLVVEVRPDQWLEQIDFDSLLSDGVLVPDADGVIRPEQPHAFQSAWLINFHDPDAFRVRVE